MALMSHRLPRAVTICCEAVYNATGSIPVGATWCYKCVFATFLCSVRIIVHHVNGYFMMHATFTHSPSLEILRVRLACFARAPLTRPCFLISYFE